MAMMMPETDILSSPSQVWFISLFIKIPSCAYVSTQGSCAIDCRKTAECSGFTYYKADRVCTLGSMEGQEFRDCYGTTEFSNEIECGEWQRVRHLPQGNQWFPQSADKLRGIETYGDPGNDTQVWSVAWNLQEYQEFLFTSVDLEYWMIVSKEELIGSDGSKWYSNEPITITASSESDTPYQAKMYRREYVWDDPHIALRDYHGTDLLMYKEGGYRGQNTILGSHGGMDVYIRRIVPANQQANDFASTSTVH